MKTAALSESERKIAKKLLTDGRTYQDVQQLINTGRTPSINPGRLAGWAGWNIDAASDDEVADCPLSIDVKKNLTAVKVLRDNVEHKLLASIGRSYWSLFQANCLNFDQTIRKLFGEPLGLDQALALSLQFGRMQIQQLAQLQKYDLTPEIEAIDQRIAEAIDETGQEGPSYKFKVNYTFEKASKGEAHIVFTENNADAERLSTVLTKKVVGDELWPYKPSVVIEKVREATGFPFSSHHHQLAWKKNGARPRTGARKPDDCKKDFCYYHAAHKDYTYSDKWVELLVSIVSNADEFNALKAFKPQ